MLINWSKSEISLMTFQEFTEDLCLSQVLDIQHILASYENNYSCPERCQLERLWDTLTCKKNWSRWRISVPVPTMYGDAEFVD